MQNPRSAPWYGWIVLPDVHRSAVVDDSHQSALPPTKRRNRIIERRQDPTWLTHVCTQFWQHCGLAAADALFSYCAVEQASGRRVGDQDRWQNPRRDGGTSTQGAPGMSQPYSAEADNDALRHCAARSSASRMPGASANRTNVPARLTPPT